MSWPQFTGTTTVLLSLLTHLGNYPNFQRQPPKSFVGSKLSQAPCIPMWSSWSSLGTRSPAFEWVQRPEMRAHHAPGAGPLLCPTAALGLLTCVGKFNRFSLPSWRSFATFATLPVVSKTSIGTNSGCAFESREPGQ